MEHEHDEDESPSRGGSLGPESDVGGSRGGASVRKAQNRIAQREFRMRKQQYIRDLEARVEVLSGDKEERVELMTLLIRNLLKENKDLRTMVKTMASFVGEGLGSCLPRLGLTAPQLDAMLNRADTDTAHDAFLTLKASKEMEEANPGIALGQVKRKASLSASASKRRRDGTGNEFDTDHDHHSNSTPGGSGTGTAKPDTQQRQGQQAPVTLDSAAQQQQQQQQQSSSNNYDFFFPDLEAMANGRYATPAPAPGAGQVPMASPFNPYAQQSQFPFGAAPGMGGWGIPLASPLMQPDQAQNQGYGLGMGMGMGLGVPMGYGFNGGNQANFSGFGLTMPGMPGGQGNLFSPNANQGGQQNANATAAQSSAPGAGATAGPSRTTPATDKPAGSGDAAEKSRRLKEAVASLTEGDRRVLEGNPMTPQEMAERFKVQEKLMSCLPEGDQNNRMLEAMQMITYHLNNYRVNPNYVLPVSLRPTKVQKTIPHEHAIDGIIYPSIRDRMILLRGRYDIVEAFYAIFNEPRLNGEDPLDHNNWELSERWLTEFRILCDDEIFDITNRWRVQRGEAPIPKTDNPIMRGDFGGHGGMY